MYWEIVLDCDTYNLWRKKTEVIFSMRDFGISNKQD